MIICTCVDFDGNILGTVRMAVIPEQTDLLIVNDTPYMVYSRQFNVVQEGDMLAMSDITLICITEQAMTPDHDYKQGGYVKDKYKVQKADGTPTDPNANYFVLRLDTDPNALTALKVYADSVQSNGNALLAEDLRNIIKNMREHQKRVDLNN